MRSDKEDMKIDTAALRIASELGAPVGVWITASEDGKSVTFRKNGAAYETRNETRMVVALFKEWVKKNRPEWLS